MNKKLLGKILFIIGIPISVFLLHGQPLFTDWKVEE